jgi:hypothetical protein
MTQCKQIGKPLRRTAQTMTHADDLIALAEETNESEVTLWRTSAMTMFIAFR